MKKKLTLILTTLACIVAFAFCVTACGETNNGDNTQTPSVESAKSIVGDEVDRATWDAAVSAFNKKNNYKFVCSASTVDSDFGISMARNYTVTVVDYNVYLKGTTDVKVIGTLSPDEKDSVGVGKESVEIFIVGSKTEEKTPVFLKENGKWTRVDAKIYYDEDEGSVVTRTVTRAVQAQIGQQSIDDMDFTDYEYDNDLKGYRLKDNGAEESVFIVKIKDGKVKAVYKEYEDYATQTWDFVYTYGGQSVTVPTV